MIFVSVCVSLLEHRRQQTGSAHHPLLSLKNLAMSHMAVLTHRTLHLHPCPQLRLLVSHLFRLVLSVLIARLPIMPMNVLSIPLFKIVRLSLPIVVSSVCALATLHGHATFARNVINVGCFPTIVVYVPRNFGLLQLLVCVRLPRLPVQIKLLPCKLPAKLQFSAAGMNLREWSSNDSDFMSQVPSHDHARRDIQKCLGILWDTANDVLQPNPVHASTYEVRTKHHVLRVMSKFF